MKSKTRLSIRPIERKTKIDEAQLDEDEKEQVQQDLDALQPTPEEEDSGPIDEETRARAVLSFLDENARKIACATRDGLNSGVIQIIDRGSGFAYNLLIQNHATPFVNSGLTKKLLTVY